jgi:hypothetical protein
MTDAHIADLVSLRKEVQGPQSLMTTEKAINVDGEYRGGIKFERHDQAINSAKGPWCYQLAATIQSQKALSAPGVQSKVTQRIRDKDAQMRFDLLQVSSLAQSIQISTFHLNFNF